MIVVHCEKDKAFTNGLIVIFSDKRHQFLSKKTEGVVEGRVVGVFFSHWVKRVGKESRREKGLNGEILILKFHFF